MGNYLWCRKTPENQPSGDNENYIKSYDKKDSWADSAQLDRYLSNPKNDMSYYLPDQNKFPNRWMQTEFEKFEPTIIKWR